MSVESTAYILNTRVDNLEKDVILNKINSFLDNAGLHHITTLNPEILLEAHKNNKFQNILNTADLNIADGIGLKFAFWRYGKHLKTRYSGADLVWDILKIANEKNFKVYLIANKDGLSTWQETKSAIKKVYPDLKVIGENINKKEINKKFSIFNSEILINNLGAPYQEMLINNLKNTTNPSLRLGVGVGGTFDYMSGKVTRAPQYIRNIGLEWLYRLLKQPKRTKRIFNAIIKFPLAVLFTRTDRQKPK